MTCMWSKIAKYGDDKTPRDVPRGHVAVTVGAGHRRFVIKAHYLNHALFRELLHEGCEDYGYQSKDGPLFIPCDESLFQDIIQSLKMGNIQIRCAKKNASLVEGLKSTS